MSERAGQLRLQEPRSSTLVAAGALQHACEGLESLLGGESAGFRSKREGTLAGRASASQVPTVVPGVVEAAISSPAAGLDLTNRALFERRFAADFSAVKVHTGATAAASARLLRAHAYTVGQHIFFDEGKFAPHTDAGRELLAHELIHVEQQRHLDSSSGPPRRLTARTDPSEREADQIASEATLHDYSARPAERPAGVRTAAPVTPVTSPVVQGFWSELIGGLAGAALGAAAFASAGLGGVIVGALAGGAVGALAGHLVGELLGKEEEEGLQEAGVDENDPEFKKRWQSFLSEGLGTLYAAGCRFPDGAWRYDSRYWEKASDPHYVAYKPKGVSPSHAVDKLFENLSLWDFDCALYPEVAWLYAYRHALGNARFDRRFKNLVLRQHQSVGIREEFHDLEGDGAERFNKLWNESPVGTKVMWTNKSPVTLHTAWHNENALKSVKGATWQEDLYDAHPLGHHLTEERVMDGLASNASDYPKAGGQATKQSYIKTNIYRHQLHLLVD